MDKTVYRWSEQKAELLKAERGLSFEDIVEALGNGRLIADIQNPKERFAHQRMFIVDLGKHPIVIPYIIEEDGTLFLKTAYPDRKLSKVLKRTKEQDK
ncbi:MAG: DUF4258 domain-containing protein [Pseudomonadota bacterium]